MKTSLKRFSDLAAIAGLLLVIGLILVTRIQWPDEFSKANHRLIRIHKAAKKRGDLDDNEVRALDRCLSSTQAVFRETAASIAADAKSASSRRALQPALIERLHDSSAGVRKEAIAALESFGDKGVIPKLQPLLRDPDAAVASEARLAVEDFGQKTAGIGIALGERGGNLVVAGLFADSPAALNGTIHPGDRLIAVGQGNQAPVEVKGFGIEEAVRLLRGRKGTRVTVTVVGSESPDPRAVSLVRDEFTK
jgi:HEAT repeats/PDZ domain